MSTDSKTTPTEQPVPPALRERALELAQQRLNDADGDTARERIDEALEGAQEMQQQARAEVERARRQLMASERVVQLLATERSLYEDAEQLSLEAPAEDPEGAPSPAEEEP